MATLALVDDDENIVASLRMFFEAEGYAVRTYHDGEAALPALTETPAGPCHTRCEDAAYGRDGAAAPPAPNV